MIDRHPSARLVSEDVGEDGSYSGLFEAYGLFFTIVCRDGVNFIPRAAHDNPKRSNWLVEAAVRLCQSAAFERRKILIKGEK